MLNKLNIPQPPNGIATNEVGALEVAKELGYPILVRPSFVLGGRAMQIVYSDAELQHYMRFAVEASPERPVLVDKFLEDATEVDVDCIADVGAFERPEDGTIVLGGILEHIEFAGVHSGDAAMVLPPHTLSAKVLSAIRDYTYAKSQIAAGGPLPMTGRVFISVSDAHKKEVAGVAQLFADLGFELIATAGTAAVLEKAGLKVQRVFKLTEGRPNTVDLLKNREIHLVINTPAGQSRSEER